MGSGGGEDDLLSRRRAYQCGAVRSDGLRLRASGTSMKWSSCNMPNRDDVKDDSRDGLGPSAQVPSEIPIGVDRRKFIMRSAVISAAAVMNGCARSETEQKAPPPAAAAPAAAAAAPLSPAGCRPERGDEGKGAGADDRGRVLQGGPWPVQLAHDRSDAHHLRFLPAGHQAAGRQARRRRRSSRSTCSGASARRARDTARNEPRSPGWSGKNRQRSTRCSWTACETSLTRCSR